MRPLPQQLGHHKTKSSLVLSHMQSIAQHNIPMETPKAKNLIQYTMKTNSRSKSPLKSQSKSHSKKKRRRSSRNNHHIQTLKISNS